MAFSCKPPIIPDNAHLFNIDPTGHQMQFNEVILGRRIICGIMVGITVTGACILDIQSVRQPDLEGYCTVAE